MKTRRVLTAITMAVFFFFFFFSAIALPAVAASVIEHTFVVRMIPFYCFNLFDLFYNSYIIIIHSESDQGPITVLDFVGTCICTQVSQMKMTHLCKETPVTVVNGQLPGPVIDVTEGDSVVVHVVNKSPYNITIHW